MNGFLRRLLNYDTVNDLVGVAQQQMEIIRLQQVEIGRLKVEYSRWGRDMIAHFLVVLDKPEEQEGLRDVLHMALIDMADEVARLEEHAPH
jgi:hypothetical protein